MALVKNRIARTLLFALGWACLVVGVIGIFLPVLPTTPFLLVSSWCFFKSSPTYYNWLYNHPHIGKAIKDWQQRGAISKKSKTIAILLIIFSLSMLWINSINFVVQIVVTLILSGASIFILTRPH